MTFSLGSLFRVTFGIAFVLAAFDIGYYYGYFDVLERFTDKPVQHCEKCGIRLVDCFHYPI